MYLHAASLHGKRPLRQPFTTLHTLSADVKELTPEFYYLPDFLENGNAYHLGTRQVGWVKYLMGWRRRDPRARCAVLILGCIQVAAVQSEAFSRLQPVYCLRPFLQDGVRLGDVRLPAWAGTSPHTFIHAMREALEGPHASASMHQWIDLVFGCKQRGAWVDQ